MFLLWLVFSLIGLAGYVVFAGLWVRYIFAHIGGLGVIGLLGCLAGSIAIKKDRSYGKAFFAGFVPPIILGVIAVGLVYASGGHGCGGIVSLSVAAVVIVFYGLIKKKSVGKPAEHAKEPRPLKA